MTKFSFRGKPVKTVFGIVACIIFMIFMIAIAILLQPIFWLFGRRGMISRNLNGGIEVVSEGALSPWKQA